MLSLLLLFVFTSIFLYRLGSGASDQRDARPWQGEFLNTAAVWGALLVGITEGLSLFYAINQLWLAISWGIVLAVVLVIGWIISTRDPTGVFRKSEFKPCAVIRGECPKE